MEREITADNNELLEQGWMTASEYMRKAVREIDGFFGDGYAIKHPELVGTFIQAATHDLGQASVAKAIEKLAEEVERLGIGLSVSIDRVAGDTPMAEAIQNIAAMLDLYSCGRAKK